MLQEQTLTATLSRQRQESLTRLELEEATNRVKLALTEREIEFSRLEQEIRNLTSNNDLASRLIERLPELAAQMPATRCLLNRSPKLIIIFPLARCVRRTPNFCLRLAP